MEPSMTKKEPLLLSMVKRVSYTSKNKNKGSLLASMLGNFQLFVMEKDSLDY